MMQDNEEYGYAPEPEVSRSAYSVVQIDEKTIEPDTTISAADVNRNWQLGNIDKRQFFFMCDKLEFANMLSNFPDDQGGWLTKQYAQQMLKTIDKQLVLSNSQNGFARKWLNTRQQKTSFSEQSTKGWLSLPFKRRNR